MFNKRMEMQDLRLQFAAKVKLIQILIKSVIYDLFEAPEFQ